MGLFAKLLYFATGVYVGVWANQAYKLPKFGSPSELLEKASKYFRDLETKNDDIQAANILKSLTDLAEQHKKK